MKVFVKIIDATIKKNPNAGRRDYHVPMGQTITVTVKHKNPITTPENDPEMAGIKLLGYDTNDPSGLVTMKFAVCGFNTLERFLANLKGQVNPEGISYDVENHVEHVQSITPEPSHYFKHEDPELTCGYCDAKFLLSKAAEVVDDDGYSQDSCPKCGEWLTHDIQFESLKEAQERMANQESEEF